MGTYYYLKDKKSEEGPLPVYEDDYIQALYSISKRGDLKINDAIILEELGNKKKSKRRKNRCIILIDDSNFYFKLKELGLHNLLEFNFSGFAKKLAGNSQTVGTTYYIGKIKTDGSEKSKRLQADQQKLFTHLKKHSIRYSLGYLLKSDSKYHEKGVDVNIAVDMLSAVYEDSADRILLVSSDTDLLPAINKAKEKGKSVEYIGFSHQPSVALVAKCSQSRLFARDDLLPFIKSS